MNMKKTVLITAALLMGSAGFTYASAHEGNFKAMTFAEMDKNSDGQLSKDEVGRRLAARFEQLDTDNSNTLSADEFSVLKKGRAGKDHKRFSFTEMDKNNDGQLSKDEVGRRLAAHFDELDTDNSDTLSADELSVLKKGRAGKGHKRFSFTEMDKNNDGQLSKDEVGGRLTAHFEKLDSDNSGTLSADELSVLKKGRAGKGHKRFSFTEMDKNNDGQLSKDEVGGRLTVHFDKLDSDNSGTLSADELSVLKKGRAGKHHKRHHQPRLSFAELDTDGNGSLSESEFAAQEKGRFGKDFKRPAFAEMDKNSDGKLAKDEVRGRLAADFEQLDKDGNGTLSADELPRAQGRPLPQTAE